MEWALGVAVGAGLVSLVALLFGLWALKCGAKAMQVASEMRQGNGGAWLNQRKENADLHDAIAGLRNECAEHSVRVRGQIQHLVNGQASVDTDVEAMKKECDTRFEAQQDILCSLDTLSQRIDGVTLRTEACEHGVGDCKANIGEMRLYYEAIKEVADQAAVAVGWLEEEKAKPKPTTRRKK